MKLRDLLSGSGRTGREAMQRYATPPEAS